MVSSEESRNAAVDPDRATAPRGSPRNRWAADGLEAMASRVVGEVAFALLVFIFRKQAT